MVTPTFIIEPKKLKEFFLFKGGKCNAAHQALAPAGTPYNKYICNEKMGSESEFSDYVLNLLCDLRVIYKENVDGNKENGK